MFGFTGAERHQNWPANFVVRGTPRKTLKETGRAAKTGVETTSGDKKWYYMVVCGAHELHGEEGRSAGLMRLVGDQDFVPAQPVCGRLTSRAWERRYRVSLVVLSRCL